MKLSLKAKKIDIRTGNKFIVVLHEDTAKKLDLYVGDRVLIQHGKNEIVAILEISDAEIKKNVAGIFVETYSRLHIRRGGKVTIMLASKPVSLEYIRKKLDGEQLSGKELDSIVKDIVHEDLSDIELTYFVSGCYAYGLNDRETADLTKAIVNNGSRLSFKNKIVMDKHCIGGVPGNRTTMLVIPILTALGFIMPKTSSRAITSPSGTADTMEVLASVVNDSKKLMEIVKKEHGFITWGGGVDLAAADDHLIRVRHPLSLDPEGMLLASIMAKKHSVSANTVLIDIPIGPQAKVQNMKHANHLKKRFLTIAKLLGMKAKVIITDGSQPIGHGVGPILEALDVMKVLKNEEDAPQDLREKSIYMAGLLIDMSGRYWWKKGKNVAREVLDSGKAYDQMQKIIKAQGAKKKALRVGKYSYDVGSPKKGVVKAIHNKKVSQIARLSGAPKDAGAGLYVHKRIGDEVKKNEPLFTIYANSESRLEFAKKYVKANQPYTFE